MLSEENVQLSSYFFAEEPYEEIEEDVDVIEADEQENSATKDDFSDEELTNYENLFEGNFLVDMWD